MGLGELDGLFERMEPLLQRLARGHELTQEEHGALVAAIDRWRQLTECGATRACAPSLCPYADTVAWLQPQTGCADLCTLLLVWGEDYRRPQPELPRCWAIRREGAQVVVR